MQTNVAYWRLWILLSFIAGGLVVYDFNSSTCATCESSGKRDEQPQTTLRGVVDRQPQTLTLRARPEVGLPTSADYIIERESHSSIQPCNPEQTSPAGRAEKFGPILLSQGVMRFGTSARRQEVDAVDMINKMQFQRSVCGPLAEIGVYKGWFVAALTSIAANIDEKVYAYDLYEDQATNVDNSASAQVHKPLVKYFWDVVTKVDSNALQKVMTVKSNSMELEPRTLMSVMKYNPRIISVDGAHFGMAAFSDLLLVAKIMHPEGVIAMDDYNNKGWPGVMQAVMTYEAVFVDDLSPFLATGAKFYLCKKEMHATYLAEAKRLHPSARLCPVSAMPANPDTRVEMDKTVFGSFVDISANNGDEGLFCPQL
mmetsp:Transcript_45075/g.123637  ORF Transcript_45075/g.123637 Transcript_45075/m.123637 type:complete len:369 (+) Transcript_45075:175-1281(+)